MTSGLPRPRSLLLAALAAALVGVSGCGGDDESTEAEEHASTPEQAIAEIGQTQRGVAQGVASYASGDAAAAAEQVTETYLQHFELVEGPLAEVDPELTEELEEQIREQLVGAIEAGDPVGKVKALGAEIDFGLVEARGKLQAA